MAKKHKTTMQLSVLAGLILVSTFIIAAKNDRNVRVSQVKGTLTFIDVDKRQASIEVLDKSTGLIEEFSGLVPDDCDIFINGNSATLADLRVSDRVEVQGRIIRGAVQKDGSRYRQARADWIRAVRSES